MKKMFLIIILLSAFMCALSVRCFTVNADELSDNIKDQIQNIDLSQLEDYYNNLDVPNNDNIINLINNILNGKFNNEYNTIIEYFIETLTSGIKTSLPSFAAVLGIIIIGVILRNIRTNVSSEGALNLILFVSTIGIILILSKVIINQYTITKNTIDNIAKLTQIMSPIIITLIMASGGNVSASIYTPTVAFLSTGIINIVSNVLMPLIGLVMILSIVSNLSTSIKLEKFIDFFNGIIKWVLGIIITIFTIFLSVKGITSATFDGISIKATKYALSNTIPIVGGFIKDGFDLVIAGSILIKNAVGIGVVYALFYTVLQPVISMLAISFVLKFISSIAEIVFEGRLSNILLSASKFISYLIAMLFVISLMLFITLLLMIFSANSFV